MFSRPCDGINGKIQKIPDKYAFICSICSGSYSHKGNLVRHIKEIHEEEKKYECHSCGSKYTETRSLNIHMSSIHGNKLIDDNLYFP